MKAMDVVTTAMQNMPPAIRRRGPTRWYSRPTSWLEIITPIACGNVVRPDCSAESPRSSCRKIGRRKRMPAKLP